MDILNYVEDLNIPIEEKLRELAKANQALSECSAELSTYGQLMLLKEMHLCSISHNERERQLKRMTMDLFRKIKGFESTGSGRFYSQSGLQEELEKIYNS